MTKKKATAYGHLTPDLVAQVKDVIQDSVKHNYSVSKIYAVHNAVMRKNDQPQTCGSCLRNRVRELKNWLGEYEKAEVPEVPEVPGPNRSYELADGSDVLTIDAEGKATRSNGRGLSNGRYETKDGGAVVVSGGSKGRYEEDLT